jgi:AcrR family transcriptional regulator
MDLVTKQREERKQRILEVGRRLIATQGFEGVRMRELAEESLVSVPTLYNLFGGKNELLSAVVESYFQMLLEGALRRPTEEGLQRIFAICRLLAVHLPKNAKYARSLMTFSLGTADSSPVLEFVSRELSQEFALALEQMQGSRQLVAWVSPEALADRMASLVLMVTFEWGTRLLTDEALEAAMLFGSAALLLGFARGKAEGALEAAIREHQAAAAIPPGHGRKAKRHTGSGES